MHHITFGPQWTSHTMVVLKIVLLSDVIAIVVCVGTSYDVHILTESPKNTFLSMSPYF